MDDITETENTEKNDSFGLDKDSRLEAKRAAEVEDGKPKPPFPHRVIALDPVMVIGSWT